MSERRAAGVPGPLLDRPPAPPPPRPAISAWHFAGSAASFLVTLFTATTLGAGWYLSTRTDLTTDLLPWLAGDTIQRVWTSPDLVGFGLRFSLPLLAILLCHELGHYLICRRHGVPAIPPYFVPAPVGLGTFGAFIRIRAPIRDRRQLLDVGAGGPIAGFVALVPFLLYGVARSAPAPVVPLPAGEPETLLLLVPGSCLALELATWAIHGPLPAGTVLDLHPFALAAWVGLLATALNLLPLGQLDGGHILYAAAGRLQRRLAIPLWLLLVACGFFWRGWLIWAVVVLILGMRHPPVVRETPALDPRRRLIAWLCLVLFVLTFIPAPISVVPVAP